MQRLASTETVMGRQTLAHILLCFTFYRFSMETHIWTECLLSVSSLVAQLESVPKNPSLGIWILVD